MTRARLTALLDVVEAQIDLTQSIIEAQRHLIENMRARGVATGEAETQLTLIEARLLLHQTERETLLAELSALPEPNSN